MELTPATIVGPYEVLSFVGAGGMGEVYRVRDTRLERDAALKILPATFSLDDRRLERFQREARATAALSHPNIVAIFDVGAFDGRPDLVTELLDGQTLRSLIASAQLSVARAAEIGAAIARGQGRLVEMSVSPGEIGSRSNPARRRRSCGFSASAVNRRSGGRLSVTGMVWPGRRTAGRSPAQAVRGSLGSCRSAPMAPARRKRSHQRLNQRI